MFFKQNFARQGFLSDHAQFWEPRKNGKDPGRPILVGKGSGRLKRSIKKEVTGLNIRWFSDVPYAEIHNDGGTITSTQSVRAHVRKIESRSSSERQAVTSKTGKVRKQVVKTAQGIAFVKANTRQQNTKIPQRQFLGNSPILLDLVKTIYHRNMEKLFNEK